MMSSRLLPKVFVLLFLALLVHGQAQAQGRGYGNRPGPVRPITPAPPSFDRNVTVLSENIFRNYTAQSTINLQQLFRLGAQHRGMQLEQVVVTASSAAGRGQISLDINGLSDLNRQTVSQYSSSLWFFTDPQYNTIGQDIRSADLTLRGNIYVETIELHLRVDSRSREEILQASLWDYVNFSKVYQVRNTLNMGQQYNNRALGWVEIKGSSPHRNATARLLINGRQTGIQQSFHAYESALRFDLPRNANILGRDIQNLQIEVNGTVHVLEMRAGIQGQTSVPPRLPPAFVEQTMNLHLTGQQNISLESVVADSRGQDLRGFRVASVEITARARFNGATVRLCERSRGWNSGTCQSAQRVGTTATFTSHFANGIPFEDLDIQNSGEIVIQKVTVRFQR